MRLLTKIIGKTPSEMDPEELTRFVQANRARIRREIKEYRKLKLAIKVESPKKSLGRPKTSKAPTVKKSTQAFMNNLSAETGLSQEEILAAIKEMKEKKNG